jgi:hypothetical protein
MHISWIHFGGCGNVMTKKTGLANHKYYLEHKKYFLNKNVKYYKANKSKISLQKRKHYIKERNNILLYQKKYRSLNKKKVNTASRKYYKNNTKQCRENNKIYCIKNKKDILIYKKEYERKRKLTDVAYKIKCNLKNRIWKTLKKGNKSLNTNELVGCDSDFLKKYLEKQFKPKMNWNNYGFDGWHVDHIIPCCQFDLSKLEEQRKCFHYTNLQPLWAKENLSKGGKL